MRTTTGQESHGIVTPGDVLAYRRMWDSYVVETVRAAIACADAWDAAAQSGDVSGINTSQFKMPPDATTMHLWATQERQNAESLLSRWNAHADTPDWQLLAQAGDILIDFQKAVLRAGQIYRPNIAQDCPKLAEGLPPPPTFDFQAQAIGRLEGLGVVAHGLLQLLGIGVSGVLDTAGAIGQKAADVVRTVTSPAPWLALGLGLGGILLLTRRA